jgi:hypothetical protein
VKCVSAFANEARFLVSANFINLCSLIPLFINLSQPQHCIFSHPDLRHTFACSFQPPRHSGILRSANIQQSLDAQLREASNHGHQKGSSGYYTIYEQRDFNKEGSAEDSCHDREAEHEQNFKEKT